MYAIIGGRLILVGDIHGMKTSFDKLMAKLNYDPSQDRLVHLGDFMTKGPHSVEMLAEFALSNVTGVRGNHEEDIIGWREWIDWAEKHSEGGAEWLTRLEARYPDGFSSKMRQSSLASSIPSHLTFMDEHYQLAKNLTISQYNYLRALPVVIHIPSLHAYVVHAGILPFDPRHRADAHNQPLARRPQNHTDPFSRVLQERSLLTDIKQNRVPFNLLNIRSVSGNGKILRKHTKGTPWADLWNMVMDHCEGYNVQPTTEGNRSDLGLGPLPCLPFSAIYGHAAARGLDVKRWSFGLDTGCVKGRKLTAMYLTINESTASRVLYDRAAQSVPFGEQGEGHIVSIRCS
ncbi:Metallo-dependent phosphatase [Hysterangium stoloniferum]|nr:Metallo-dependent phosphatase [Hysterangium stoloniferum]